MNIATLNIHVCIFVKTCVFISSGDISRACIAGSYGTSVFNFSRSNQTVFQSSCTVFHSHQQCMLISPVCDIHQP